MRALVSPLKKWSYAPQVSRKVRTSISTKVTLFNCPTLIEVMDDHKSYIILLAMCWMYPPTQKKSEMKVYNESLLKNICFIIHKLELSSWVPEAVEVFCFQATVSVNVCGNFPSIKGQKTRRFFPDEARLGDLALRALGGGNCSLRSSFPSSLFQPGLEP